MDGWALRGSSLMHTVTVNRAPVLTLWAAIVAERLGFEHEEALTLGKVVAGLTAQSKGQRLGIFTPSPAEVRRKRAEKAREAGVFSVALLGRAVPVLHTDEGLRARGQGSEARDARECREVPQVEVW